MGSITIYAIAFACLLALIADAHRTCVYSITRLPV